MKTKRTLVVMFMLVLALLAGAFPGSAAFAEDAALPLRFVCDETVASVTVYDPAGLPVAVGADGIHHLTPGTYFYSATAEGYESTGLQAFTIPADAAGDQELRISLTPVPGSVPPGASTPGETPPDASVPGQTPVNAPDSNALKENPEDDGKLRIRPVDGSLTLTIERETKAESAVPPEVQRLLEGKQKPLLTPDGKPVEKKLYLKTPDAEELYLDRLAVEKEIGYYTTDWTVLNLIDEEGDRKNLLPVSGWYDVTVSGPATEQYRDYEPVFALVTLHWDEEGDIVDRDVQILETTHTPTKSSWSFSTDTLSTLVIAVPTDQAVIDETAKKPALTERTLVSGDGKVEVSGLLPEDAQLVVVEIPLSFAAELYSIRTGEAKAEEEILFAYDISILSGGEKFQPEDFGESVRVSVGGLKTGEEPSDVLHVKADAVNGAGALDLSAVGAAGSAESELLPVSAEDGVVAFETEGFSVFIGATKGAPLRGVAASGTCGDNLTWSLDENGTLTISGTGAMDDGQEWYDHQNNIKSVVIENGVTTIGYIAFEDCGNLGSIEIPASVTTIGDLAFLNCVNLTSVTFADGSQLERIGNSAFELCVILRSIEIPSSVTSIGASAFKSCDSLKSIEIPSGVKTIGVNAFSYCYDLQDIWYHGTESQWENVYREDNWDGGNNNLTVHCELSIKVSSNPSAGGTVTISSVPGAPAVSGPGKAWSNTNVTVTATANSNYAFVNWTENVNGSVTTVSTDASYSFTATTDRDLVANFAIGGTCGENLTWTLENGTLTISGTGAMYDSVLWNGQKENIKKVVINNGVTTIGDLAFFQCVNLGSVEIPSSVTTIRSKAFEYCTNLTSVTFADGSQLERIGDYAFELCVNLQSIQIPSSVTSIGASAFLSCGNLESVTFAEGSALTSMGVSAFQLCKKLTSVTIPSGVTSIENYAFDTCTGLTDVTIPSSVTSIGNYAFNACSRLGSIEIPAGVKSIGVDAFRDCESLESVTIPSSVTSIGNFAFCSCSKLESVTIPSSVTSMGVSAFQHCKKLTSVTIERSDTATVLAIGSDAFLCGTDSATLSWTGNLPEDRCVVFEVSPDSAGYSIKNGTTLSWSDFTGEATLTAHFVKPVSVNLQVTKEFNDWSKAPQGFTFNLAAVTENAPMPANNTTATATATATEADTTAVFGEITYDAAGRYEYTITETDGGAPGVSYDTTPHNVVVTVTKAEDATNALSATVKYDGQASLIVTNTYSVGSLTVSKTVVSGNAGDKQTAFGFTVTLNNTAINGAYGDMTFTDGVAAFSLEDGQAKTADSLPSGILYTVTEGTAEGFTTTKTGDTGKISSTQPATASFTNTLTPATSPTISKQPENLNLTYGYTTDNKLSVTATPATDGSYDLGYQWYSCEDTVKTNPQKIDLATEASFAIPTGKSAETTEYYYCEVTATRTDNGQTATATSNTATVTVGKAPLTIAANDQYYIYNGQTQGEGDTTYEDPAEIAEKVTVVGLQGNDTVTSVTIDGQGKDPDTYDLTASAAAIGLNGNKTANYAISYVKGKLTILPPAVAEINVTKVLEGRNWKDGDSFTFELAAVNGAPMPASSTATAKKDEPTASFGEVTYYSVGPFEYTITESKGSLNGVTYDTAPHTVLVTVTQADPTAAPTATVAYDGQDSLTVTNTFTPATATLEVTKSLKSWRAGDSFTFTLAAVTEGAPMPPNTTATATEQNKKATFDEITYETSGSYEYTITETDGGKPGVTYDTAAHNVVVTVSKNATTNALSATVAYDGADSLEVTNTRQFYGVVIDTSMTGGTVTATPASAAAGDTVTLTVTPDKGSELTSLTVTATGTAVNVDPDQNDPNRYSFVMPATGVAVTATFKEILYTVVEGADSSWLKGSNGDLSIRVKRDPKDETCFQHFRKDGKGRVAIDGTVLSEDSSALIQKDYKAEEGSTVITLHKKMLNRLSAGKHTVTITFDDGSVSTGLTILVPPGGYSPGTGDSARVGFWAALMVLAGLGFAGADYARRRLRRPRYVGKH